MRQRVWLIGHMTDNYRRIFLVPADLDTTINRELRLIQLGKIERPLPVVPKYCERVSREEYERQKSHTSQEHLVELLGSIVRDENMSSKVKKKKLKMVESLLNLVFVQIINE